MTANKYSSVWIATVAAFACFVAGAARADAVADHKMRMDDAGDLKDGIHEDLHAKKFPDVASAAANLVKLAKQEQAYWAKSGNKQAIALAQQYLVASQQLQKAAAASDADGSSKALETLEKSCLDCHAITQKK
jgi:cytochrome c556